MNFKNYLLTFIFLINHFNITPSVVIKFRNKTGIDLTFRYIKSDSEEKESNKGLNKKDESIRFDVEETTKIEFQSHEHDHLNLTFQLNPEHQHCSRCKLLPTELNYDLKMEYCDVKYKAYLLLETTKLIYPDSIKKCQNYR